MLLPVLNINNVQPISLYEGNLLYPSRDMPGKKIGGGTSCIHSTCLHHNHHLLTKCLERKSHAPKPQYKHSVCAVLSCAFYIIMPQRQDDSPMVCKWKVLDQAFELFALWCISIHLKTNIFGTDVFSSLACEPCQCALLTFESQHPATCVKCIYSLPTSNTDQHHRSALLLRTNLMPCGLSMRTRSWWVWVLGQGTQCPEQMFRALRAVHDG